MVLLIDDDDDFRAALAANLRYDGHRVCESPDPHRLPALAELGGVEVLITDYQLDGSDGLAFADRFHEAHPAVPVIMITAYWTEHLESEAKHRDFLTLLRKPVDYEELHETFERLQQRTVAS